MTDTTLHAHLAHALQSHAGPRLVADQRTWSSTALLDRAQAWTVALRDGGLRAGDRVLIEPLPAADFMAVVLAALELRCTLVPCAGEAALLREPLDAVAHVTARAPTGLDEVGTFAATSPEASIVLPQRLRPAREPRTPGVRFLLRTSGTTGTGRWIALSEGNIRAVLDSHVPVMDLEGARLLSTLPWHHVFGLVIELFAAIVGGATVVRAPELARDPAALASALRQVTHFNAVPLTVHRLAGLPEGRAALRRLRGGAVGGAAVRGDALDALIGTRLRVGYGQTEAAPGICFGDPGAWRAATLGRPLGCDVRCTSQGELEFRGPNACIGEWRDGRFVALDAGRWVATGDLVRVENDGTYTLTGRATASFKLANGRLVEAARLEEALRAAVPELEDVVVTSSDGLTLDLWCCERTTNGAVPIARVGDATRANEGDAIEQTSAFLHDARLIQALGPLARLPRRIHHRASADWPRTPKGDADRRAIAALAIE